ncbi:MAG: gliding motility-associated C-terminal domain-containing protein [Saprospiraceae bacterium]|nr:gliding motility-associated C-terminal domain-containing protein [Saprospiraceae bacterium]
MTDIYGCVEIINISIRVKDNTIVTIPNIINGSGGNNNYFTIYGNEGLLMIKKMSIFDRWGNLVFLKENFLPNIPQEGWDGKMRGSDVVPGVFVYTVEYMTNFGSKVISGDITVIK